VRGRRRAEAFANAAARRLKMSGFILGMLHFERNKWEGSSFAAPRTEHPSGGVGVSDACSTRGERRSEEVGMHLVLILVRCI